MTDFGPSKIRAGVQREGDQELLRLRKQLRAVERQLHEREDELAVLRASRSFKLTAPLRWLRRRLLGLPGVEAHASKLAAWDDQIPAAIKAFPRRYVRNSPPDRLNDTHRPLDLDDALRPLVDLDVMEGRLRTTADPFSVQYLGEGRAPFRVATVVSPELAQELSFDTAVLSLDRERWEEQLRDRVDFLLLDGCWEPEGRWGAGFGESPATRERLRPLLNHCRRNAIPVVLWAREDAAAIERLHWLAAQSDRTYAVDQAGKFSLEKAHPGRRVAVLPVAVQPALYNPVRSYGLQECGAALEGAVLFDGWWAVSSALTGDPVMSALGDRLRVVDTRGEYSWARLQDQPPYAAVALGALSSLEKSALLRSGAAELFVDHPTAPHWQQANDILRALASGARVIHKGAPGGLPWVQKIGRDVPPSTALEIRGVQAAAVSHLAFRDVLTHHCLADRLSVIASDLGLNAPPPHDPRVAHLLVTMRPELLEACLERFRKDRYHHRELVVVLHGEAAATAAAQQLVREGEPVTVVGAPADRSLGDCLNMAIAHTDAPFWLKIDDDDHYGPEYTKDIVMYRRAIRTPLMGKPPAFLHLESTGQVFWDPQWASYSNLLHDPLDASDSLVAGGTLGGTREVLESMRFSSKRRGGSDSEFIERCLAEGHSLLATDPFNFARYRTRDQHSHTWKVSDQELMRGALALGDKEVLKKQVFI